MHFAFDIVNAPEAGQRFRADSFFIRMLVRSLKIPNSFYFPFDSLQTISKLYAPDSSFRIFTWQVKKDVYVFMQRGAIQMRTDRRIAETDTPARCIHVYQKTGGFRSGCKQLDRGDLLPDHPEKCKR